MQLDRVLDRFVQWLNGYGELSWDHQTYFAGAIGGRAKALYYRQRFLGTLAVAPMILSEAFLPNARRLFARPLRFPIADAHYAMGFVSPARAIDTTQLAGRSCKNPEERCGFTITGGYSLRVTELEQSGTPLITTRGVLKLFGNTFGLGSQMASGDGYRLHAAEAQDISFPQLPSSYTHSWVVSSTRALTVVFC
jgi:hypothetical protein